MTVQPVSPPLPSFEVARHIVEEQAARISPPGVELGEDSVELLCATGRVLSRPVLADRDFPPFARATRDGYAVRAGDLVSLPAKLDVIGEIKAGADPTSLPAQVSQGQAVSIMTGAPVPAGADAVVMVEYSSHESDRVEITKAVAPGDNVVPRGAEACVGRVLLERGVRLNSAAIALAASVGKGSLQVFKRPRIAVLATGDEIVEINSTPGPTQIRNSNSYSLAAQIQQAGGEPVMLPIAPDESGKLRERIEAGLQCELLIIAGGVSMGRYDLVEQVLAEMRAEFFFTGAKIQPGRPVVFGKVKNKYFFGLPGNPVSTMVTFELFARPMLEGLSGMTPRKLIFTHARLKSEIRVKPGLKRFLPAILSGEFEGATVELVPWQGSGDIAAIARANCYAVIPPDRDHIAANEWMPVMIRE